MIKISDCPVDFLLFLVFMVKKSEMDLSSRFIRSVETILDQLIASVCYWKGGYIRSIPRVQGNKCRIFPCIGASCRYSQKI